MAFIFFLTTYHSNVFSFSFSLNFKNPKQSNQLFWIKVLDMPLQLLPNFESGITDNLK
jgi:hypothetical protein